MGWFTCSGKLQTRALACRQVLQPLKSKLRHHVQGIVKGVGVMAPAVKQTMKTEVNPGLSMGDKQGAAAAIDFFKVDYPTQAPLHILGGKQVRGAPNTSSCFFGHSWPYWGVCCEGSFCCGPWIAHGVSQRSLLGCARVLHGMCAFAGAFISRNWQEQVWHA